MNWNCDACGDNRYELIDKAKKRLVDATNIEDSPEEMAVLDNILLRFWQMGWLDPASKIISLRETVNECREQNAKLRQERDHWHVEQVHAYGNWEDAYKYASKLEAENAKLRELAKAAWGCVNRHVSCDECRMVCYGCTLQSAMRELGIEVD